MRLATRAAALPAELDVNRFVLEHGRLPFLSDPIPPWHYRGWLLFQVQLADGHPEAPGRWSHYLRTFEAGHLLDEPIPRINFSSTADPAGLKMVEKCVELLSYRDSPWSAFGLFVAWLAWGMAVSKQRPQIEEATSEALYRTFNFEPLILHPYDYLGEFLAGHQTKGWNPNAFFPTPHAVCELMTQISFGEITHNVAKRQSYGLFHTGNSSIEGERDPRLRTVNEPAVGTGRLLLHASNYSYRLSGMDKDKLVLDICLCNGAFYAPWLSFPFPKSILKRASGDSESTSSVGTSPAQPCPRAA
ncbi:hypothetical protein [Edaphobacter dinghuensis]|uniref:Uncharacterized protein n=1 Tax=Edaphobacter dinghuensis TaxID=1560005 RepID=A0A917M902_9BACT|nr:hypothetical protein [Edaphobacter dinghuensis]GGG86883.1 hypothetical protein GCM10011585_33580 [Edaphobacter dinghuensis]